MTITAGGVVTTPTQNLSIKTTLLLDQVDNTSDINKPISTAQTTALALKPNLAGANTYTGLPLYTLYSPSYAATLTIDASTWGANVNVGSLTGPLLLANPVGFSAAATVRLWLTQDATGSRLISFGTKFKAAGGIGTIALSTAASAVDLLQLTYNPTKDIWAVSIQKAIA